MRRVFQHIGAILPTFGRHATCQARVGRRICVLLLSMFKESSMLRLYDNHLSGNGYKPRLQPTSLS